MDLTKKIVAITGGNGFLGKHLCAALAKRDLKIEELDKQTTKDGHAYIVPSRNYDLTSEPDVARFYYIARPQVVIHLAAVVGGIGINRQKPGTFYYKNLMMGAFLLEHARRAKVEKFVAIGTICAYPKHTPVPFTEDFLWEGYPEETNAPYGIAKKAMLVQAQAYRQEFGLNSIYLLPVNLYGPGDNFNSESSHVIPALIKKLIAARESGARTVECWGTGKATREFLYVEDAAEAIALATEKYDDKEPVNIGAGYEISIKALMEMLMKICRYNGTIKWNAEYPDGQPRRCLDVKRAKAKFGFMAMTALEDGLAKTVEWYERSL